MIRQAVLHAPRMLRVVEAPAPTPGPGEVVVCIRAALTCGTDLKTYRRGHPRLAFGPFGHEGAGDVVSVGEGVEGFRPGNPVMFVPTANCEACPACLRGYHNHCATLFQEIALGAYGDLLRLPARIVRRHLFHKPPALSYIEAAFLEPLACVVHGWRRLGSLNGERIAVVGVGPIGLLYIQEASRRGLEVIAIGRRAAALSRAEQAGGRSVLNCAQTDPALALRALAGGYPEVVIECTGSADVWRAAPSWVAPGGRVLLFGGLPGGSEPAFDATRLHYGEVDLISAFHFCTQDVLEALHLLTAGVVRPTGLVTGVRPLDAIQEIFDDLDRGIGLKYAVLPEGAAWL